MKIVSQKQAGFLGRIAGGKKPRGGKGPSQAKAAKIMAENRGFKMRDLPERAPARSNSRSARRSNSRSGRR